VTGVIEEEAAERRAALRRGALAGAILGAGAGLVVFAVLACVAVNTEGFACLGWAALAGIGLPVALFAGAVVLAIRLRLEPPWGVALLGSLLTSVIFLELRSLLPEAPVVVGIAALVAPTAGFPVGVWLLQRDRRPRDWIVVGAALVLVWLVSLLLG
jgi:hypothetical protein